MSARVRVASRAAKVFVSIIVVITLILPILANAVR